MSYDKDEAYRREVASNEQMKGQMVKRELGIKSESKEYMPSPDGSVNADRENDMEVAASKDANISADTEKQVEARAAMEKQLKERGAN